MSNLSQKCHPFKGLSLPLFLYFGFPHKVEITMRLFMWTLCGMSSFFLYKSCVGSCKKCLLLPDPKNDDFMLTLFCGTLNTPEENIVCRLLNQDPS